MGKFIDLTGQKFNFLTVLYRDTEYEKENNLHKGAFWRCKCDCGNEVTVWGANLKNGGTKSCGCLQKTKARINGGFHDLAGKKFGRLTVINLNTNYKQENPNAKTGAYWNCICDCGNRIIALGTDIFNGKLQSCGCLRLEKLREACMIDLTGQQFGYLTVLKLNDTYKKEKNISSRKIYWDCQCKCGAITTVEGTHLRRGEILSCGCLLSKGEEKISQLLIDNNIKFEKQKIFSTCKNNKNNQYYRFDFWINDSFLLEFDGIQHYQYTNSGWNTKENYEKTIERDNYKNNWCLENNIPLKRIPYTILNNITIEDILSDKYLITGEKNGN